MINWWRVLVILACIIKVIIIILANALLQLVNKVMTASHFNQPIRKIAVVVLLVTACRNSPSAIVRGAPNTPRQPQKDMSQPVARNKDSLKTAPKSPAFRYYILDLNDDGMLDTIALRLLPSDTNHYTAVTIGIKGYGRQSFRVADTARPWTDFDDWFADSSANAIHTRRFFLRKGASNAVLLLFGNIDETSVREGFTIIKIQHNRARQVLDQITQNLDIENVLFLRDLDNDGRFELICNHTFEFDGSPDTIGGLVGPYNPSYVYTIDDTCFRNKPLMRQYNQENYLFAGYAFSNSIKVFYPDDRSQKPRLWHPK